MYLCPRPALEVQKFCTSVCAGKLDESTCNTSCKNVLDHIIYSDDGKKNLNVEGNVAADNILANGSISVGTHGVWTNHSLYAYNIQADNIGASAIAAQGNYSPTAGELPGDQALIRAQGLPSGHMYVNNELNVDGDIHSGGTLSYQKPIACKDGVTNGLDQDHPYNHSIQCFIDQQT